MSQDLHPLGQITEVLTEYDKRRELKKYRFDNEEAAEKYREANNKLNREIASAKEAWINRQCSSIEDCYQRNDANTSETCLDEIDLPPPEIEESPVVRSEIEEALKKLKCNKAPGTDNISAELMKSGGDKMIDMLLKICNRTLATGEWPTKWTESVVIPLPKKGNIRKCENNRTISLISHPSKVLLYVMLNRMKPTIKRELDDAQARLQEGRSTTEQICNLRILSEKYQEHQKPLYHNSIDFKKAFDRVWHKALWTVMRKYISSNNIIKTIMSLYDHAKSLVFAGGNLSKWFRSKVGVRLDTTTRKYGMEISSEKNKVMVTAKEEVQLNEPITVSNQELEQVSCFKYFGSQISYNLQSQIEIKSRIAIATAALVKLDTIWKNSGITVKTKTRCMKAIVLATMTYGCESWTLNAESEKRINAFEMKFYRKILRIPYTAHRTNENVKEETVQNCGNQEMLQWVVKRRKIQWFGHVTCNHSSLSLANTIMHGRVPGKRGRGRPRKTWLSNIQEWTNLSMVDATRRAADRNMWKDMGKNIRVHLRPNDYGP
ncbi:uncharacterized protein LOC134775115 [Penaeus indicus]|uniref:uncharacterized protein LOC134775115 n=1 Tax=Penaeus indicus TaxID=29960 RepID=UPI00300C15B8